MIAFAILAMITTLCWGSFRQTVKTKNAVESQSGRYRTVRIALERLSREISMAYLSQNEQDPFQQNKRTFFIASTKVDIDELRFSYLGHQRLYQDADEGDTAQIVYYSGRDRDNGNKINLMRRETRRLNNLTPEQASGESDIVCDDVIRLKLQFWDSRDKIWRDEWSTIAATGQLDRLPSKVSITLTVRDERGEQIPFFTEVRLAMQEPLNSKPTDNAAAPTSTGSGSGSGSGSGTGSGTGK